MYSHAVGPLMDDTETKSQPLPVLLSISGGHEATPRGFQELYLASLEHLGIDTSVHDIRFVEDNFITHAGGMGPWLGGMDGWYITSSPIFSK